MKREIKLTPIKDYSLSLKGVFFYLISLLGCMILITIFPNNNFIDIIVNVQEMGDPGVGYTFSFPIKSLIKIILLGMVHGTISYVVFKNLLNEAQKRGAKNKTIHFLEITLVWIIAALILGHVIHWLFDRANYLYRQDWGGYNVNPSFLLVYFADEDLSHGIIHISYYLLFLLGVWCELQIKPRKIHKDEILVVIGLAVGIIILNGEAALQGESAFPLLLLSISGVIIMIILIIRRKLKLLEYPLMLCFLLGSIGVILYDIIHVLINSFIPYYPFIT